MSIFNRLIVWILPFIPKFIVYIFAKKYIAGPTLQHAVDVIKQFNNDGVVATVDILGEDNVNAEDTKMVVEQYKDVIIRIEQEGLESNISVKPTHLGLKIDKELCYNNIRTIVEQAQKYNNFVRIDMEDHTCTSDTIELYLRLKENFSNVGVVLQSYLRRTIDDVDTLIRHNANIRLCKGIYSEPRKIAYKDYYIINENFQYCLEKLLQGGCYVGIATHDEMLVWHALSMINRLHLDKNKYEFQMLLGVDEALRDIIVSSGHRLRVYVPFGQHWHAYSVRRLKENPSIAMHIIKNMFGSP